MRPVVVGTGTATEQELLRAVIVEKVDALRDEILSSAKHLYEHPELSGEEYESSKFLAARATQHGFKVEMGIAGLPTSFRATKGEAKGRRPRLAYLAEYDALPGIGHGCGHNFIGTASTYAAIALGSVADELPGDVVLFGTPAEETDGGKITMLDAGVFEGVDAAMMVHPGSFTEVAYTSLACIGVEFEFFGKTAHAAAAPWKGINALDPMIQLFVGVDLMRKALPPTARTPGVIVKGGSKANVIPDHTVAEFSLRGKDKSEVEYVFNRVLELAKSAASATQTRLEYHIKGNNYWEMRPDAKLAALFKDAWAEVGGEEPSNDPKPHGSLDIGNLSHHFPCLHPSIRITPDDSIGGHTRAFADSTLTELGQEQLVRAVKALALTGLKFLSK